MALKFNSGCSITRLKAIPNNEDWAGEVSVVTSLAGTDPWVTRIRAGGFSNCNNA